MTAMPEGNVVLSEEQRAIYAGLADILIPSAEGMPSASEAEVPRRWIDEALRHRPDLTAPLVAAIEAAAGKEPEAAVEYLNTEHIPAFEAMGTLTAGAYFLNPRVKELIGYPGQVPTLAREDMDTYADLLENVLDRGQIYREAPADSADGASASA